MNDQPAGSMSNEEAEMLLSSPTEATPGPPTVPEAPKIVLRYIKQQLLPRQGTPEAKAKLRADMRMGAGRPRLPARSRRNGPRTKSGT